MLIAPLKRLVAAAALTLFTAQPVLADALVDNVRGVALDRDGRTIRFTGILMSRDGKVIRLLKEGEARPAKLDWRADMKGRIAIPGMIDAHGHVMSLGYAALSLDLSGTTSLAQAQEKIRAYAADHSEGSWIRGGGWNQEVWKLGRFPNAADLDAVAGAHPAWLSRADGHAGWANSAALKIAGITARTPDPAGGRIERDAKGNPTGVLVDSAMDLMEKKLPQSTPRERNAAFLKAQDILLSQGVTATADMGTPVEDWLTFRRMGDAGLLRVRIMSYALGVDAALAVAGQGPTPWLYDDRLRMGGIKLYADGALGSRGAWLKAPYSDAPGQSGLQFLTDAQLKNSMTRGAMDGFQIAVHAIGDRANQQVLDAVEDISDTFNGDRRWRIEHAQIVDPADLARFAKLGVVASMQPVHQTSDRLMAEARLGPDRMAGAYAWNSMLKSGAKLAFGSDFPVEFPNPFIGWAAAMTRQGPDDQPPGGWHPEEAVTRDQAWRAYTWDAAWAGFADGRFGGLAPGLRADFLIVDRDPSTATADDLRGMQVLETWVGGTLMWEKAKKGG